MRTTAMLVAALLTTAVALPTLAQPARQGAAAAQRGGDARAGKQKRLRAMRHKLLRRKLGLSEARASKVEKILERFTPQRREIKKETRAARRSLRLLFRANSDDQQAYKKALARLRAGHKAMQQLRDSEFTALQAELTPKEQAMMLRALQQLQRRMQRMRARNVRRGQAGQRGPGRIPPAGPRRGGPPGGWDTLIEDP